MTQRAYVVFSGKTEIKWLRFLKPGFRHCFVLLNDGQRWISVDSVAGYIDVIVHDVSPEFDFAAHMRAQNYTVIAAPISKPMCKAPLEVISCVSVVKRILGLHKCFVFTPWQLFKFLQKIQKDNTKWEV